MNSPNNPLTSKPTYGQIAYVDWDGLVYYDGKIKQHIRNIALPFGGSILFEALPDPSFDNQNYIYEIKNDFISDNRFELTQQGYSYNAGTWVRVTNFDDTFFYTVFIEKNEFQSGQAAAINTLKAEVAKLNISDSEKTVAISNLEANIASLSIKVEGIDTICDEALKKSLDAYQIATSFDTRVKDNTDTIAALERVAEESNARLDLLDEFKSNTDNQLDQLSSNLLTQMAAIGELTETASNHTQSLNILNNITSEHSIDISNAQASITSLSESHNKLVEVVDTKADIKYVEGYIDQAIDELTKNHLVTQDDLSVLNKTLTFEINKKADKDTVYSKDEVDSKVSEINNTIANLNHFTSKVVSDISEVTESGVLYLIKDESAVGQDKYNEYIFIENEGALLIGDTTADLSGYVKTEDLEASYYTATVVDEKILKAAEDTLAVALDDTANKTQALADQISILTANSDKVGSIANSIETALADYYTKSEDDAHIDIINQSLAALDNQINTNADKIIEAEAALAAVDEAKLDKVLFSEPGYIAGVSIGGISEYDSLSNLTIGEILSKLLSARIAVLPESITFDTTEILDAEINAEYKLISNILPSNATETKLIWESSDPDIASVTDGTVRVLSAGEAVITATTINGKSASCKIVAESKTIIDYIISNKVPSYCVDTEGQLVEIPYEYFSMSAEDLALETVPNMPDSCFYQAIDADNKIIQSGYQIFAEYQEFKYLTWALLSDFVPFKVLKWNPDRSAWSEIDGWTPEKVIDQVIDNYTIYQAPDYAEQLAGDIYRFVYIDDGGI